MHCTLLHKTRVNTSKRVCIALQSCGVCTCTLRMLQHCHWRRLAKCVSWAVRHARFASALAQTCIRARFGDRLCCATVRWKHDWRAEEPRTPWNAALVAMETDAATLQSIPNTIQRFKHCVASYTCNWLVHSSAFTSAVCFAESNSSWKTLLTCMRVPFFDVHCLRIVFLTLGWVSWLRNLRFMAALSCAFSYFTSPRCHVSSR